LHIDIKISCLNIVSHFPVNKEYQNVSVYIFQTFLYLYINFFGSPIFQHVYGVQFNKTS